MIIGTKQESLDEGICAKDSLYNHLHFQVNEDV